MVSYLFVGDETNVQEGAKSEFFAYGAVVLDLENARALCRVIEDIRNEDFESEDVLKFDTRSRPDSMSPETHRKAKDKLLDAAHEADVRFMGYVVLHKIAGTRSPEERQLWALKTLLLQFQLFLEAEDATGVALVDRFSKDHDVLERIHRFGFDPDLDDQTMTLHAASNIVAFGTTSIGLSHLSSVADVVLGAFRYCINERSAPAVSVLLPKVRRLMMRDPGDQDSVEGYGLLLRPHNVKVAEYREKYEKLRTHLRS